MGGVPKPGPARTPPKAGAKPPMTGGPYGGITGGVVKPKSGEQLPPTAPKAAGTASTTKKVKSFMKKYGQA